MDRKEFEDYLQGKRELVDAALEAVLPPEDEPPHLIHRAVRYSVLAPGKRLRPILCLDACRAVGGEESKALKAACGLEMIHAYSLIHDDLPSMDDDEYRRGRLTSHKVFGEGIAILAGDALLSLAFETVARDEELSDRQSRRIIMELATASGGSELVGGQQVDLISEGKEVTAEMLDYIHAHKTGALITASVKCGAFAGGATDHQVEALADYGAGIGLAFQIKDDILDVKGDREKLGKTTGQDEKTGKATYPAVWGIEKAERRLAELLEKSRQALETFGPEADSLREIARFIGERDR